MTNYRMIACAVDDYDASLTIEQIAALSSDEQDYFERWESNSLEALRLYAVEHSGEWFASVIECLVEDLPHIAIKDGVEEAEKWAERAMEIVRGEPEVLGAISQLKVGEAFVGITSAGDWIRIEEAK